MIIFNLVHYNEIMQVKTVITIKKSKQFEKFVSI